MKIPAEPPVGHLVAYEYLWSSKAGVQDHGEKTYPAAIILAREGLGSATITYSLGISHSPPRPGQRALPVPPKLKRWLGLDALPSWIYPDQINIFVWPGPDLQPADRLSNRPDARDSCVIGALPDDWFKLVLDDVAESYRLKLVTPIKRNE
ncbi:growth inhibitor PemK [Rhizobium sp. TH2]|uniref:growth inhibitor PemK n=1 Tax=Rhizobium sp. TH2 TaxID=2775403 RepID=UPI0021579B90|nr:growth inhibitor PemK [Rhizobium sp. TH2]UVC09971.1 growth inhibitor PemK [Rhizobium sp. TH2]